VLRNPNTTSNQYIIYIKNSILMVWLQVRYILYQGSHIKWNQIQMSIPFWCKWFIYWKKKHIITTFRFFKCSQKFVSITFWVHHKNNFYFSVDFHIEILIFSLMFVSLVKRMGCWKVLFSCPTHFKLSLKESGEIFYAINDYCNSVYEGVYTRVIARYYFWSMLFNILYLGIA
jgi:hypothetical protein